MFITSTNFAEFLFHSVNYRWWKFRHTFCDSLLQTGNLLRYIRKTEMWQVIAISELYIHTNMFFVFLLFFLSDINKNFCLFIFPPQSPTSDVKANFTLINLLQICNAWPLVHNWHLYILYDWQAHLCDCCMWKLLETASSLSDPRLSFPEEYFYSCFCFAYSWCCLWDECINWVTAAMRSAFWLLCRTFLFQTYTSVPYSWPCFLDKSRNPWAHLSN